MTARTADKVIAKLRDVLDRLEPWQGDAAPLPPEAVDDLAYAYEALVEIHRDVPGATAWCVVKHYAQGPASPPRPWPCMAFADRDRAEEWADFLSDFYNTWGDWFTVERMAPHGAVDHTRPDDRPVGTGYHMSDHDSRVPMERWWQSRKTRTWSRKAGHVRCAECRGSGSVVREDDRHRYDDCPACDAHGWLVPTPETTDAH